MLNRTNLKPNESLEVRHAVSGQLRVQLRDLPPTPFDWGKFEAAAMLGQSGTQIDLRLQAMARLLCMAPARTHELRALWKECVVTAAYAWRLAPLIGADPDTSAIAGLLHRLGDILTIRAIGEIEYSSRLRLDATSKAELCLEFGTEVLERVLRAWGIPSRAAATASEWRRMREFPSAAADATAVYLARLFAIELLMPQFCASGVLEHAAEEASIDPAVLSGVRADATIRDLVANLQ
jgi:HD-like signal output (HDOD) protein